MSLVNKLTSIVGKENILLDKEQKTYASIDRSNGVKPSLPLMVVKVSDSNMLTKVVKTLLAHKTPLVVRAMGTGKTGGAIAGPDTVVIDITKLNNIIEVNDKDLTAIVEPGVVLSDLKSSVEQYGLYYPPDPASCDICSIGGNVAENASGPSTLKYGSTKDYVLGGQAITGNGEVINFGKYCPKGVAGYDVTSLLVGSEGTLAVFTKIILRLLPQPLSRAQALFLFDDDCLSLVNQILTSGYLPKSIEYIDYTCLASLKKKGYEYTAGSALIIECDDHYNDGAQAQINAIKDLLNGKSFLVHENISSIWSMRSELSLACEEYLGYKISEDIAVPLGQLQLFADEVRKLSKPPHIVCGLFGHAGDGNLHVQIMYGDKKYQPDVENIRHKIIMLTLKLNGTIAAEHGIGLKKKQYLLLEQGLELVELQKQIKKIFDPHNLLNPGKIFDE